MNLALDFGNTRIKAGLFRGEALLETYAFADAKELLNSLDLFAKVDRCILGSVTRAHEPVIEALPGSMNPMVFSVTDRVPLKNLYQSALTLGSDRMAAAVGAYLLYPGRNVLTVDAGTCIKYNFVNEKNEYLGGAISPGVQMRLSAMNHFTDALPLAEAEDGYAKLTGATTKESLLSGAMIGAACEIDGMTERYCNIFPDLIVLLTGGDADYLSAQLKKRFFAHQNLVLTGLNHILNLNSGR